MRDEVFLRILNVVEICFEYECGAENCRGIIPHVDTRFDWQSHSNQKLMHRFETRFSGTAGHLQLACKDIK
jgi:hypothetical protein